MNEHADNLLESTVDLIKQVLRKHTVAVLEEMRDQVVARNTRIAALEAEVAALKQRVDYLERVEESLNRMLDEVRKESRNG